MISSIEQLSERASVRKLRMQAFVLLVLAAWLLSGTGHAASERQSADHRQPQAVNGKGVLGMNDQRSIHAVGQSGMETHKRTHARAKITVQSSEAKPYDQSLSPALLEIRLIERFAGDLEGEATVRALQVQRGPQSANLVSMQRFRGKLGGRQGSFVLQGSEIVENGKIKATWFVVPGSGTGALSGLRGNGGFEGEFGKGSEGTLDYWFE